MTQRTCGTSGCPNAHRAKGLCSSCYNRQYQPDRHRKSTTQCTWCGRNCLKATTQRYAERFCSLSCRDTWRRRDRLPVLYVGQVVRPEPIRPEPPRSTKRWVAGRCHRCGKAYVAEDYTNTAQFCSLTCARRLVKHRYRARKHKAYVANVSPRLIHERDGWTCQLCLLPIDLAQHVPEPLAAVIDHVIPLARGGTHQPSNVQCAHFLCNSIKSDRVGSHAG